MLRVSIYGQGQLGCGVADILGSRGDFDVSGPFSRHERDLALTSGADAVLIATTSRLADVSDDIRMALDYGSNVLVSAEESANPYIVDSGIANEIDNVARRNGLSVAGVGVNPGLIFDSLLVTILGAAPLDVDISTSRKVDIGAFGPAVLRRIGIGLSPEEFVAGVESGHVLGHAGFPQSISLVAEATNRQLDRIDKVLVPILAEAPVTLRGGGEIPAGHSVGVDQTYVGVVSNHDWYTARFTGHVAPVEAGIACEDSISLSSRGSVFQQTRISPGFSAQIGSQYMIANSVARVVNARPGWVTILDLPPAMSRLR